MELDKDQSVAICNMMETEGWNVLKEYIDSKVDYLLKKLENAEDIVEVASVNKDKDGLQIIVLNTNITQHKISFWKEFFRTLDQIKEKIK